MADQLQVIENEFWQVGILPETGASLAFARVRHNGEWLDILRPTPAADYGNSSRCSSFIMLPWCNRIRDAQLRFGSQTYQLRPAPDDGTARHGDVRNRPWRLEVQARDRLHLSLNSLEFPDMNFPFRFSARALFWLERRDFVIWLSLKNEDTYPMPGGFGHHPYFVRPDGGNTPVVQIPCSHQFELVDFLAIDAPVPVKPELDFRQPRRLNECEYNDLLTRCQPDEPVRITYPDWNIQLALYSDPIFQHILIFTPLGKPFFAVEPMTNANDGFNLYVNRIPGSGVFVLLPGEDKSGMVRLRIRAVE
ncbi:MAG: aldose epimerase [Chloroflexi bacterium]|nr:aldose epimerase [Chloroflexota bacterium]